MSVTITAFERSPDRGRGLARDFRVRWALEEVGEPYAVRTVSFQTMKQTAHLSRNPFGQIPTYEEGDLILFESGAILLHIGERHPGLLPTDPDARARAIAWLFAAQSTVEPPVLERSMAALLERDQPWYEARLPLLDRNVRARLDPLAAHLDGREWLEEAFGIADIMMVHVVRRLGSSGLLADYPAIVAYIARAEARPAYQRAFADQLALFEASEAKS